MTFRSNANDVADGLKQEARDIVPRATSLVRHYGQLLVTRIQANASGRPGPRAVTGDYRRSWGLQVRADGGHVSGEAGTDKPQGRRLEKGFVGVDSRGRHYDQPPFPHAGPALDAIEPDFTDAVQALPGRA